jgi:hypothetical protein
MIIRKTMQILATGFPEVRIVGPRRIADTRLSFRGPELRTPWQASGSRLNSCRTATRSTADAGRGAACTTRSRPAPRDHHRLPPQLAAQADLFEYRP